MDLESLLSGIRNFIYNLIYDKMRPPVADAVEGPCFREKLKKIVNAAIIYKGKISIIAKDFSFFIIYIDRVDIT